MTELIKISQNENKKQIVDARELHKFLESKRDFLTWIKDRIEKYDFIENQDFEILHNTEIESYNKIEYILTLDMAKKLAMIEHNEKGVIARRYFIECEKKLKEATK